MIRSAYAASLNVQVIHRVAVRRDYEQHMKFAASVFGTFDDAAVLGYDSVPRDLRRDFRIMMREVVV